MNGTEGMVFALAAGTAVMTAWGDEITQAVTGGASYARAQAASEVRRAKQVVTERVKTGVRDKLDGGKAAGPKSAWWWAQATVRSAGAVRRGLRGMREGATGGATRTIPAASPWRRVFDAAAAGTGAGFRGAREAKRARRATRPGFFESGRRGWARTEWRATFRRAADALAVGVCDNCGTVAARAALEPVTRATGTWLLCAGCRATPRPGASALGEAPSAIAGAGDAPGPAFPTEPTAATAAAVPNANGALMTGTSGQIARRTAAPACAVAGAGDVATHGDYDRNTAIIADALAVVALAKEAMLGGLRAVDAGAGQVKAIRAWADMVAATERFIRDMLAGVNARLLPYIDVIDGVGGTTEVARPAYYEEI